MPNTGKQFQGPGLLSLLLVIPAVTIGWVCFCPCGSVPGTYLGGTLHETPVTDWRFANYAAHCQLLVQGRILPHVVNVNCYASDTGDLYLNCAECDGKRWAQLAAATPAARIRIGDGLFDVALRRIQGEDALKTAWSARRLKFPADRANSFVLAQEARPSRWGAFTAVSRQPE